MTEWYAAANGAWAATSSVVAILALAALIYHCQRLTSEARRLCVGAAIAGMSATCHRIYWSLWLIDGGAVSEWVRGAPWLSLIFVAGIVAGTWIALSPYARLLLGRAWVLAAGAYVIAAAVLASWLV